MADSHYRIIILIIISVTTSNLKKKIDVIEKLDSQREGILRASKSGKELGDETKKEYEEIKSKKNAIVEKDKKLSQQYKECLDVYNSIIDEKKSLKSDLDAINIKSKTLYNPR